MSENYPAYPKIQKLCYTITKRLIRQGVLRKPRSQRCIDCGKRAEQYHHYAGYEHPEKVVPVCFRCHLKRGLAEAKARGVRLGRPPKPVDEQAIEAEALHGFSLRRIGQLHGISHS